VSDDIPGKNSASWVIYFCQEPLYNEGFSFALGQQASLLQKRSLPQKELPTKVFLLGQCNFVSNILRHIVRHRKKKTGCWLFHGGCKYDQKMTAQVIQRLLYLEQLSMVGSFIAILSSLFLVTLDTRRPAVI
jgi:hypothetical protein